MTNRDLAPADLLEASNHGLEVTFRAQGAVRRAITLVSALALYAEGVEFASRGAREAAREILAQDLRETQGAIREAARLLDAADPLGCVDCSELHWELAEARRCFHSSLAALGVDPLALAA